MSHAALAPAFGKAAPTVFMRQGVATAAGRVRAADAELRRHLVLTGETALVHGPYRQIGLRAAEILPFNT